MPWSPPKKISVQISLALQIIGIFFGLIGSGITGLERIMIVLIPSIQNSQIYGLFGTIICFIGWIFLMLGVMFRQI